MLLFHPEPFRLTLPKRVWWSLKRYQRRIVSLLMAAFRATLLESALCDLFVFWRRWIKEAMGWGRRCCVRERMKRRFITPQRHHTWTHTHTHARAAQSGLVISSSPSPGGSWGGSQAADCPLHLSSRLSTWTRIAPAPTPMHTLHSSGDGAVVEQLSLRKMEGQRTEAAPALKGAAPTEHFHWKMVPSGSGGVATTSST